jgi:NAD+ diphosphatase
MSLSAVANTFTGSPLDRASERRGDESWLAARLADPASRAIMLWNGEVLVAGGAEDARLAYLPIDLAQRVAPGDEPLLFLGLDGEAAGFAFDLEAPADPSAGPLQGLGAFAGLRDLAIRLSGEEAAVVAAAKGVFEWRRRHRFCASCGSPSRPSDAGWKRVCPACQTEHFPRTDPVVIMLPVCGERCILGHNVRFKAGLFSTFAGFVEPGESLEEACVRELKEETGLVALEVAYHSSQPWPFPGSLMIGLIAEVADTEATPDQTELEAVRWFTREEARALLDGRIEDISCPVPFAIAHQLIKSWAEAGD